MNEIQEHIELVDLYFLHCYKKLENDLKTQINQYLIRFLFICVFVPINQYMLIQLNDDAKNTFNVFICIILAQNLIQTFRHIYFYCNHFKNTKTLISIATSFNHCLNQDELRIMAAEQSIQQYSLYQIDHQSQLKVSSVFYDFQNKEKNADVQQHYKAVRQKLGQNSIKIALQSQLYCYKCVGILLDIFSAGVLIYASILCIKSQLSQTQNTCVQIYILFEIMFKTRVFGILVLLMMAPIILFFALMFVCFCKRNQKANLPKVQNITNVMIARCSDCAICFQNFQEKEEVIQLPCSNLHIFHQGCIDKWAKINPKCPICRHNLI